MSLKAKLGFVLTLGLIASQASATDVAILRNGFTIRHESRAPLGETTRLFLTSDGSSFVDVRTAEIDRIEPDLTPAPPPEKSSAEGVSILPGSSPAPAPTSSTPAPAALPAQTPPPANSGRVDVAEVVGAASDRYRLDPDLVNSVIRAESGFKVHAVSPKGAQGLMQLMPQTASKLGVANAFDPAANVDGGTRYLRELLEQYNFDLIKALAAYNAGPQRVEQYKGVPPYRETRLYVASIVRDFNRKKLAQQKAAMAAQPKIQAQAKSQAQKSQTQRKPVKASTPAAAAHTTPPTGN
jgi:soluble lytic murein transglycosylase-like protein